MNTLRGSNDHYQQWTKAIIVLLYSDRPGPLTQKSDLDMQVSLLYLASDFHNLFDEYSGIPGKVAHDQAMAVRGEICWFLDNLTTVIREYKKGTDTKSRNSELLGRKTKTMGKHFEHDRDRFEYPYVRDSYQFFYLH